jgi:alkylhydroperoxidase family enzyme
LSASDNGKWQNGQELMSGNDDGEKPPRIAPRTDMPEELRQLAMPPKGFGTSGEVTVAYRILLNHPAVVRDLRPIGEFFLRETLLPIRDRELLILRASWLCRSPYEWGEHVAIGKANGVTAQEVEAITVGSTDPIWNPHDRALLCAVEEVREFSMITDETWAALAQTYDDRQLIEIPVLIGQYQATAYWLNCLRIPLRDGNPGLAAR